MLCLFIVRGEELESLFSYKDENTKTYFEKTNHGLEIQGVRHETTVSPKLFFETMSFVS